MAPQKTCSELGKLYGNLALRSQALTLPRAMVSLYFGVPNEHEQCVSQLQRGHCFTEENSASWAAN